MCNGVSSGTLLKVAWPQARIPSSQLPKFQFALRKMWNDMLVGGWPTPLKNMSSSVGMIMPIYYGKIKTVPNHQPDIIPLYNYMIINHYMVMKYNPIIMVNGERIWISHLDLPSKFTVSSLIRFTIAHFGALDVSWCTMYSTLFWHQTMLSHLKIIVFWVNYKILLTWIVRPFGDDFPYNLLFQRGRKVRSLQFTQSISVCRIS